MLYLLEDVVNNPRDIALAVRLAGAVGTIERILQLHQELMNTMAQSNGILHSLLQNAMPRDDTGRSQPMRNFLADVRRVVEGIDSMTVEVARAREALHWDRLLVVVEELKHNPQDIELAVQLARAAADLRGIYQLHQNVFTRAAESHALLHDLISDEENPSGTQRGTFLPVPPASNLSQNIPASSRTSRRTSRQPGRQVSSTQWVYRPSIATRLLKAGLYVVLFALCCFFIIFFLLYSIPGLSQVQQLEMRCGFAFIFLILATVFAIMALWRAQATLITTPEGIEYATFGFRLFTPWENVEGRGTRIEVRSIGKGMSANHVVSGLRLRQLAPVFQVRPWVRFMLAEIRDDPSCFIPISDVVADWSTTELADEIRRYAPMGLRDV
jgi:hypothetical protein